MKQAFEYSYQRDIIGLLWLALAFFLSLALGSYYPLDPSFNSLGAGQEALNKCGYLGSFSADLLYQLFGLSAWIFVLLSGRQAMRAFQKRETSLSLFLVAFGLFVCSSLLDLHQPGKTFFEGHIYPGGLLGKTVIKTSSPYLQAAGSYLVFWSLALILFVLTAQISLSELLVRGAFILKQQAKGILQKAVKKLWQMPLVSKVMLGVFRTHSQPALLKQAETPFAPQPLKGKSQAGLLPIAHQMAQQAKLEDSKAGALGLTPLQKDYFFQDLPAHLAREDKSAYLLPETDILTATDSPCLRLSAVENEESAKRLLAKLNQFSISGKIMNIRSGPVITLFEFKPEDHIKVARISQMEDDLMIALKSKSIRIIAPIPGKDVVGIETAHNHRQTVYLKNLLEEPGFWKKAPDLPLVLGRKVDGSSAIQDLGKIPHLMVAGSTGSGKSVFILSFLLSLLFRHSPDSLRLLLVDPKQVDLSVFAGLPHLLAPPVRESKPAVLALQWCLNEMQKRYRSLSRFQVRDLKGFNEKTKNLSPEEQKTYMEDSASAREEDYYFSPQPYICIILEEFGDLMSSPERNRVEALVVRLAQMARACGMHLVLSMQSPRKDVVTGLIKTNIPGRISFKVSSRIDSRIILDEGGAERLLAQGDMLYLGPGQARPERHHGPFVREDEVLSVVQFWKDQDRGEETPLQFVAPKESGGGGSPLTLENEEDEDQTYGEIFNYVSELKEVSASHLQRKYSLGYPRAARFIDKLEEEGVVGPSRGSKPREVLIQK